MSSPPFTLPLVLSSRQILRVPAEGASEEKKNKMVSLTVSGFSCI